MSAETNLKDQLEAYMNGLASMGPRSCERGNRWSAGLAPRNSWPASMGPRSCERGNLLDQFGVQVIRVASMGPRSCERGNAMVNDKQRKEKHGFNGAALM